MLKASIKASVKHSIICKNVYKVSIPFILINYINLITDLTKSFPIINRNVTSTRKLFHILRFVKPRNKEEFYYYSTFTYIN